MMTMTNCKNIDMTAKELYQKLQKPEYDSCPYSRMKDWCNNMEIVEEVIDDYWRGRILVNHRAKEAYVLMNQDLTLSFISKKMLTGKGLKHSKTIQTPTIL